MYFLKIFLIFALGAWFFIGETEARRWPEERFDSQGYEEQFDNRNNQAKRYSPRKINVCKTKDKDKEVKDIVTNYDGKGEFKPLKIKEFFCEVELKKIGTTGYVCKTLLVQKGFPMLDKNYAFDVVLFGYVRVGCAAHKYVK